MLGVALGEALGSMLGEALGVVLGEELGDPLGKELGAALGDVLGETLGATDFVGARLGDSLGARSPSPVGDALGNELGLVLGEPLGDTDGPVLGAALGDILGEALGWVLGEALGDADGAGVGTCDGTVHTKVRWMSSRPTPADEAPTFKPTVSRPFTNSVQGIVNETSLCTGLELLTAATTSSKYPAFSSSCISGEKLPRCMYLLLMRANTMSSELQPSNSIKENSTTTEAVSGGIVNAFDTSV
jgi:hypothetical protein